MTFAEIFPVGVLVSLVSALVLRNPRALPAVTTSPGVLRHPSHGGERGTSIFPPGEDARRAGGESPA